MILSDGSKFKPTCVLDACTIINLIYIDGESENDFLIKKLEDHYRINVSEKVIKEASDNRFLRLKKLNKIGALNNVEKEIGRKVAHFRKFIKSNEDVSKSFGNDFFRTVKRRSDYGKENGEFYSVALSLYLSRLDSSHVIFYTDDKPAEEHFASFFRNQQIGKIEDSIDLLVFLYWRDPDFEKRDLEHLLSELHSQYATRVDDLLTVVRKYKEQQAYGRIKKIKNFLDGMEHKLDKLDFSGLKGLRESIRQHRRNHSELCNKLTEYEDVFELETNSKSNFLTKIRETLENLKEDRIYKFN